MVLDFSDIKCRAGGLNLCGPRPSDDPARGDPAVAALEKLGEPMCLIHDSPTAEKHRPAGFYAARQLGVAVAEVQLWETPNPAVPVIALVGCANAPRRGWGGAFHAPYELLGDRGMPIDLAPPPASLRAPECRRPARRSLRSSLPRASPFPPECRRLARRMLTLVTTAGLAPPSRMPPACPADAYARRYRRPRPSLPNAVRMEQRTKRLSIERCERRAGACSMSPPTIIHSEAAGETDLLKLIRLAEHRCS